MGKCKTYSTEFAVEIWRDDRFVEQLAVFDNYDKADEYYFLYINNNKEMFENDEYELKIIFIDYDRCGNEIKWGTV